MFGVLGWMIMIVESLIAAPVWAASHVIPEGEGFAGNAARQGWMLLLNILFRPILLVLGLFFSMLMMYFISQLALSGYTMYHSSVALSVGTTTGFFAFVFGNIILIGLIVALSHKSHELTAPPRERGGAVKVHLQQFCVAILFFCRSRYGLSLQSSMFTTIDWHESG
jgi:conjugal transfer/type IV secretion protein DotA/TraY